MRGAIIMTEQSENAPLKGIKIVDWTQVQSGPSCTQLLAWLGAEVIKIERTNTGDPTRNELLDIKDSWSLYYLQLNANKKSLTLDIKTPEGQKIMYDLLKKADVFVENIRPGAATRAGFGWEKVHELNPRLIMASLKGFNKGSRFANVKAFEPVAQSAGGAASATGWNEGSANIPTQSAAALGDSNSGMHLTIAILAALLQREHPGKGSYVYQSMQDAVINLCRIKLRDQLMLDNLGALPFYAVYPNYKWGKTIPRSENSEGGQVIGWTYKAKGWETDPNAYVYIVIQNKNKSWETIANTMGHPEWATDERFKDWEHRQLHKQEIYPLIESYTKNYDKYELTKKLEEAGILVGPVLDWHELENDPDLNEDGTLVKINQGGNRGEFKMVGMPFTMSNYKPTYKRVPDLGENNKEILSSLGYDPEQIEELVAKGVISKVEKPHNSRTKVIKD